MRRTNRYSTRAGKARICDESRDGRLGQSGTSTPGGHDIELLPPADYLRMSYYEKWFAALEKRVVKYGLVTKEELESGKRRSRLPRRLPR